VQWPRVSLISPLRGLENLVTDYQFKLQPVANLLYFFIDLCPMLLPGDEAASQSRLLVGGLNVRRGEVVDRNLLYLFSGRVRSPLVELQFALR
jgi:hypothetical protein